MQFLFAFVLLGEGLFHHRGIKLLNFHIQIYCFWRQAHLIIAAHIFYFKRNSKARLAGYFYFLFEFSFI